MREHPTSRRALLKVTGAFGTLAALAVPAAVLPKAEAAEHPDAELLRLGAEFDREHAILAPLKAHEAEIEAIFDEEAERRGAA